MRLVLIRHGEAWAGFHGPIAGPSGCRGLTPLGRRQAAALREHFASDRPARADALISSILPRAIETASIIAPGLGLELSSTDCDLCEVHVGEADGVDWTEFNATHPSFDMEAEPDRPFARGGDSWNSFHARVSRTLTRLAREYHDQTVVAVCHAGVIMASMRLLLGIGDAATSAHLQPTNTGITEWEYDPVADRWILRSFNEAVHLTFVDDAGLPVGDPAFTRVAARRAAAENSLGGWVARFLSSPGSDNAPLAETLCVPTRSWLGPIEVPLDQLNRLAGPEGHPVLETVADDEWRDDVGELARKVRAGHEPPPVIATYRDGAFVLEDGNHRVEALRQAGRSRAWTVVGFDDAAQHDDFVARAAGAEADHAA